MAQSHDEPLNISPQKPFGSEYRFQALFEQTPTSIQLLAADGRTIQVNKAWETLWEMPHQSGLKEFVIGSAYNVLTDPQLRAKGITAYLERAFAGESVKIPAIYYDPEEMGEFGRPRWVTAIAHPLKDPHGRVQEVMLMHEDITDQVESQRMLRASEERFRSLVVATSIMVWTTTPEGTAIEDSPSWRAFTGQSVEQWMDNGWLMAMHPDDRDHASAVFRESIASKTMYETEYRLRRADGRYCWTSAKAVPVLNADGSVKEWIGANADITAAKDASSALQASEERLKLATDAGNIGIWDYDVVNDEVILSEHACRIYGLPPGQCGGTMEDFLSQVHPDDRERVRRDTLLMESGSVAAEFRVIRPDAGQRWVANWATLYRNGNGQPVRMVGTLIDITERKRQEEALRENEVRFRTITDAMPQMVWSTRSDGYHEYYNQQWYDFTGMPVGSTDGGEWENVVHPDDKDYTWHLWQHSLNTGAPYEVRYRLRHRSGQYRWALGRALPVRDDAGKIIRWMGTCTDIHDQKLAEDALREADRRKDEFLAMLAHELRNPLAPISAAAELMKMVELDPEQIRRTSQVIDRQVRHMTGLVDDLLDVSRVTRGLVKIDKKRQNLKLIVSGALEQVMPLVKAKGHHLSINLPPEPARVLGDQKRLVQVLTNLLNNAAKYTPAGGHIDLGMEVSQESIILRIRDDGIGITAELQSRIFDLFTQAERSPDRAQGGLGIGLALVKSLVELHGGDVHCTSAGPGKGSEFIVELPCVPEEEERAENEHCSQSSNPARQLKILIVDDNADAAAMLSMYLKASGHDVLVEHSSSKALELVRSERLDVCVLDIGLPGIDGYELASRLKAQKETAGVKLIAITGYGQEQDRQKAMSAGFDHHLIKPVDTATLALVLASVA